MSAVQTDFYKLHGIHTDFFITVLTDFIEWFFQIIIIEITTLY